MKNSTKLSVITFIILVEILMIIPIQSYYYIPTDNSNIDIEINDDFAYISGFDGGLFLMNISDKSKKFNPINIEIIDNVVNLGVETKYVHDVTIKDNFAYVIENIVTYGGFPNTTQKRYWGLAIIDISDPLNPQQIQYISGLNFSYSVFIDDNFAYIAHGAYGIVIINITDPNNPGIPKYYNETGFYPNRGHAISIVVRENFAFVADNNNGVAIINVTDPLNPSIPKFVNINGAVKDLFIRGNYIYAAFLNGYPIYSGGLAIIDISDPNNPEKPIYIKTANQCEYIEILGNYALLTGSDGIAIIDISNPKMPGIPSYNFIGSSVNGLDLYEDYVYIACSSSRNGIIIYKTTQLLFFSFFKMFFMILMMLILVFIDIYRLLLFKEEISEIQGRI